MMIKNKDRLELSNTEKFAGIAIINEKGDDDPRRSIVAVCDYATNLSGTSTLRLGAYQNQECAEAAFRMMIARMNTRPEVVDMPTDEEVESWLKHFSHSAS